MQMQFRILPHKSVTALHVYYFIQSQSAQITSMENVMQGWYKLVVIQQIISEFSILI